MTIEVTQCSMCKHYSEEQYCEIWQQYITNDAFYCACGAKADRKTESNSGKPNNCDTCKWGEWYRNGRDITNMDDECGGCCSWNSKWTPKDEPQTDCAWK